MLYAFRQGFYARLGYATTPSRKRLAIDARSVPDAWRALARGGVRAAAGDDRAAIRNVYARAVARSSGRIARPSRYWDQFFARERVTLLVHQAQGKPVSGYVAFSLSREQQYSETILEAEEIVADDHAARRALFGALAAMRDQASEILVELSDSDPLERVLVDPDGRRYGSDSVEHSLGEVVGGPMIRVEDVPRALEARGYGADGSFDVVVRDRQDAHAMAVSVEVQGGRAEVGPGRGGGALETTRRGFAAIFYGGLRLEDAVALGLAEVDARVAERVSAIARIAPIGPIDGF
jgi:predicted acetyltransferase